MNPVNLPTVEVVWYSKMVTISCQVIPFIDINTIYFVCDDLQKSYSEQYGKYG